MQGDLQRRARRGAASMLALSVLATVLVGGCSAGKTPLEAPALPYVAPSFQSASVGPTLLSEYDVPTSASLGLTVKGKPEVFLSLIKRPLGGVKGLITATGKAAARDLTITSTIDDKGNIEAMVADKGLAKGLAVKLTGNNKGKDMTDFAADIAADYTFSNSLGPAGFTGRVGMKNSHLSLSGVLGHGAGLVGVFTEFDAEAGTLTEPALLASYTGSSYSLAAQGKAGGGNARLTYEQRITSSLSVAAGLFCTGNGQLMKGNCMTLAAQNEFEGGHKVRAKLDSATQTASVHAFLKNILPHTIVSTSARVGVDGNKSVGLSVKITPPLPL